MKSRIALLAALLAGMGLSAHAQSPAYPVVEIFAGYALSHQAGEANLNGWHGQAAVNLSESFGLVGDVSHHYMGREDGVAGVAGLSDVRLLSYTVGPRATNRALDPWTMFVHALFGQSRLVGHADVGGGMTERAKLRPFTMTLGGGVDLELTEGVSLRAVEIDYRLLRIDSHSSSGVRFSTGVVFSF
jgi:opacity protein-like surface antigen